jgi:hypothetical protein
MELGFYGGEVVGFLRQRVKEELAWLRRLRRLTANNAPLDTASKTGKTLRTTVRNKSGQRSKS